MTIDPLKIRWIAMRGSGNVATPIAWHTPWIFLSARFHFRRVSGSGTEYATFTFAVDDPEFADWNWTAGTLSGRGISGDIHARIPTDELHAWMFRPQERLLCSWTNPDPVEIVWGGWALIYPVE